MGGCNRLSKLLLEPHKLTKLPNTEVLENLGEAKEYVTSCETFLVTRL